MAEGARYAFQEDWRRPARASREAIVLSPGRTTASVQCSPTRGTTWRPRAAVPRGHGALSSGGLGGLGKVQVKGQGVYASGLGVLGRGHGKSLGHAAVGGVRRGDQQAAVVEGRISQGAVGSGCEGGARRRRVSTLHAGLVSGLTLHGLAPLQQKWPAAGRSISRHSADT